MRPQGGDTRAGRGGARSVLTGAGAPQLQGANTWVGSIVDFASQTMPRERRVWPSYVWIAARCCTESVLYPLADDHRWHWAAILDTLP